MPVRPVRLATAVAWTLLATAGVFLPGRAIPAPSPALATLAHVVLFAGLVALWAYAVPRLTGVVVVAAVFVAVGTEAVQFEVIPGRGYQVRDLWANFVGIGLGWAAAAWWHRRRSRLPRYRKPRRRGRPAPPTPRTNGAKTRRDVDSSVHA